MNRPEDASAYSSGSQRDFEVGYSSESFLDETFESLKQKSVFESPQCRDKRVFTNDVSPKKGLSDSTIRFQDYAVFELEGFLGSVHIDMFLCNLFVIQKEKFKVKELREKLRNSMLDTPDFYNFCEDI